MRGALAASRQGTALAATPLRQAASAAEGGTHAPAKFSPQRMLWLRCEVHTPCNSPRPLLRCEGNDHL